MKDVAAVCKNPTTTLYAGGGANIPLVKKLSTASRHPKSEAVGMVMVSTKLRENSKIALCEILRTGGKRGEILARKGAHYPRPVPATLPATPHMTSASATSRNGHQPALAACCPC